MISRTNTGKVSKLRTSLDFLVRVERYLAYGHIPSFLSIIQRTFQSMHLRAYFEVGERSIDDLVTRSLGTKQRCDGAR